MTNFLNNVGVENDLLAEIWRVTERFLAWKSVFESKTCHTFGNKPTINCSLVWPLLHYEIISKSFKSGSGNSHFFLPTSPISWNFCQFWLWQFYQLDWKANDTHVAKDHMRQPRHSEVKPIIKSELNMWFKEFFDKLGNIMELATTFSKLRIYLRMELNSIKSWDYKHSNKTLKMFWLHCALISQLVWYYSNLNLWYFFNV